MAQSQDTVGCFKSLMYQTQCGVLKINNITQIVWLRAFHKALLTAFRSSGQTNTAYMINFLRHRQQTNYCFEMEFLTQFGK